MSYNNNNAEKSRQTVQTCCSDEENSFMLDDHEVITEDGYILKLQRLVKREEKISPEDAKKPAVLLVHGLTCHGDNWCLPHVSLSYLLVEQGFDCWIPTLRGSSMKHVSLSVKSKKFWDFSFHEMGVYDLPAIINYVLDLTGNANLSYVGHSMGFTVLFALLSTNPEFCSKVNVCVGLAPAHYGEYIRGLIFKISLGLGSCVGASSYIRRHPITNRTTHKHIRKYIGKGRQTKHQSKSCVTAFNAFRPASYKCMIMEGQQIERCMANLLPRSMRLSIFLLQLLPSPQPGISRAHLRFFNCL
ncbi:putative lysosomal acid lipase/cholesteryl ester hydrolase isoform X4 [Folsomia candida]|uniref:putative lysosomal acid lipase/cholesteryl ester hydrolase isoform X4 n=1 Tax=Folsomia candida TaxID=158441 RepID=UPI001604D137|nr:putative lysosomal acid lipase/cholesteryl ester hydrolase isoform X4 [Folsomia candida]XP_035701483.1 putative lysosomal acid lipase/cholesteryl ester hydrolase isoform X4 [Folsomia candida]